MKKTLSILVISTLLISCGENDEPITDQEIPTFPAASTFLMDFSIVDANSGGRTLAKGNWGRSAIIVSAWSAAIGIYSAVPVASFQEAFNHEPTFDASIPGWVWEYDVTVLTTTYHARLESKVTFSGVEWKMLLSQDGSFQDFNWYSGTSALTGTRGTWTLNTDPLDPHPAIEIVWNRNADQTTKDLTYTNIVPGDANNGGYISYEATDGVDYNKFYEIYNKEIENTTTIEWHSENKNGRVKDPEHYADEDYHCWDDTLEDITCP